MEAHKLYAGLALVFFFVPFIGKAENIWFHPLGGYSWSDTGSWFKDSGTMVNRVPDTNDNVSINSNLLQPGTPLRIDNTAECKSVALANLAFNYTISACITSKGSLHYNGDFLVGSDGHGLLMVDKGGTVTGTNYPFTVGNGIGSGTVTNAGTMTMGVTTVGGYGNGELYNIGSIVLSGPFICGCYSNSFGYAAFQKGTLSVNRGQPVAIGIWGKGILKMSDSSFNASSLQIGTSSAGDGFVCMDNNTTGIVSTCFIGGRNYGIDTNAAAVGTLWMRGGTLQFAGVSYTKPAFFVRYSKRSAATLRGWGSFNRDNNLSMCMNGCTIADGEGVDGRTLDMGQMIYVTNPIDNGYDGTNGWYAVNKGKYIYPRLWTNTSGKKQSFGSYDTVSKLVNAIEVTPIFTAGNYTLKAALCAPDCADIPAGLRPDLRPVGVWAMWVQNSPSDATRKHFISCDTNFRYDHTKVASPKEYLWLYRYENNKWVCVKRIHPNTIPTISTGSLAELSGETYNIGWIALMVGFEGGTSVTLQ